MPQIRQSGYYNGTQIIAEVKPVSPSGKPTTTLSRVQLADIAYQTGAMISEHTNLLWNPENIPFKTRCRDAKSVGREVLAKGFHGTDDEVKLFLDEGATMVLVVGRIPAEELLPYCMLEPESLADLREIRDRYHHMNCCVDWNSRNLGSLMRLPADKQKHIPVFLRERWSKLPTGDLKTETFEEAFKIFPWDLCQASNITTVADIKKGASRIIVGTKLVQFAAAFGIHPH